MPKRKRNSEEDASTVDSKVTNNNEYETFSVTSAKGKEIACERRGDAPAALIFTHGAGGGLSNDAMKEFAEGFAQAAPIVSFKGNMNLKSRVNGFETVIENESTTPALGGRSMGARAAVLAAQQPESGINALVLASYPMVGAQKGDSREQILLDLPENVDVLFVSGSNDSMCDMSKLREVTNKMKASSWIIEVSGADHGMSIKEKDGIQSIRREQGSIAAKWLNKRDSLSKESLLVWKDGNVELTGSSTGTDAADETAQKPERKSKFRRKK